MKIKNKLMKKVLITIILFSLIALLIGIVTYLINPSKEFGNHLFWISAGIGQFAGIILYLIISNIYNSRFFIFIMVGVGFFLLALLFRINHWPYGNLIAYISYGLFWSGLLYLLYFENVNYLKRIFK